MKQNWWIDLSGSAFISLFLVTFNNVPLVDLLHRTSYYRDLSLTFAISLLLFRYVRWMTDRLDRRVGWKPPLNKRIVAQLVLGCVGASFIAYGFSYFQYKWIDADHVFGTESFWKVEFPVTILFCLAITALYGAIAYHRAKETTLLLQAGTTVERKFYATNLIGIHGQQKVNIPIDHVALISVEHGITWLFTFDKTQYHLDESLQQVIEMLDPDRFFRVNRQYIVQLSACFSYKSSDFGKIDLQLIPPFRMVLTVSQKTAPAFRRWMERKTRSV